LQKVLAKFAVTQPLYLTLSFEFVMMALENYVVDSS
jgi:hypothetical protein